jgi:hypothetical protein
VYLSGTAQAATGPASITVSPTRVEVSAVPGKTVSESFTVTAQGAAMAITSTALPFTQDAKGQTVTATEPASVSGVDWVTIPRPFELSAGASRKVTVLIKEPVKSQPGQRYVAVAFRGTPLSSATVKGAHVSISGSVAGELIIDVPGAQTHTTVFGLSVPSVAWSNSVPVTVTARDTGNSYVTLNGQFVNAGSQRVPMDLLLLGGTSHTQTFQAAPGYGYQSVSYNGQSRRVLVLPGAVLAGLGGFLLLILGVIILARRSGRRSVRHA